MWSLSDLTPDQHSRRPLKPLCQLPPPAALEVMMLSFACRSLSRHGELILKGGGPRLRRGRRSVLEETVLSWVTSCLQRAVREEARRLGVQRGVFREQMGDV